MPKTRRVIKIGLIACFFLVGLWVIAAIAAIRAARETQHEAQVFLKEFINLPPGTSSFEEIRRFAYRYRKRLWVGDPLYGHALHLPSSASLPPNCTADNCDLDFGFQNKWLYRLHLAPFTDFGGVIKVRNGRTTMSILDFVCKRGDFGFIASVGDDSTGILSPGFPARRNIQKTIINLSPQ